MFLSVYEDLGKISMFIKIKMKLLFLSLFVTQLSYAGHFTPPTPTITSGTCTDIVVHDELYGYPNHGVTDSAVDIAYRGDKNTWVFQIPSGYQPSDFNKAFFSISLVLDDHDSVPTDLYTMKISVNNKRVYSGLANLPHGSPYGSIFGNWVQRDYFVQTPLLPTTTFKLSNTSANTNADDWIGIDWIELHLLKCLSEPQPPSSYPAVDVPATGLVRSDDDAKTICPVTCSSLIWNGQWTTTVPGEMSVCGTTMGVDVPIGPIWSNDEAQTTCPSQLSKAAWNGQWKMPADDTYYTSMCGCAVPK